MAGFPQAGARRHCMAAKWAGKTRRRCSADSELVWRLRSGMDYWRAEHSNLDEEKQTITVTFDLSGGLTKKFQRFKM